MDIGFETFESGFSDFDVDVEEVLVKKTGKYDRIWRVGKGGSVCYHSSHDRYVYFGAMDSYVYKIDCVTGKELWRFRTGGKIGTNHAVVHREMVYVGSQDGYLYCIDSTKGKLIWRFKTGDEISSTPVVHENNVFIGSFDGYFYCIDTGTGQEIWRIRTGDNIQMDEPPLVYNGMIFVTSFDNYLRAINIETGKEVWRFKTGKYGHATGPKAWNGILYQGSRDGFFYALNMNGGELWRFKTGGVTLGFGVLNNQIYITSEDGNLYCLSPEGNELWRFKTGGGIYDHPTFYKGKIYFGSWDCNFYCVDSLTREESWRFETSSRVPAPVPPAKEQFTVEIKKETTFEEAESEDKYKKKKEKTVSLSDYHVKSEYHVESEYRQKSDYDTSFVMFEDVMEEITWISDLKVSRVPSSMSSSRI